MERDSNNPFARMGIIRFWIISTVFWLFFPVSILICFITIGSFKTKQLLRALLCDFFQTLAIILILMCIIIYGIYNHISGFFNT
ncbi:MAG: PTS beta-glucoside transporter subunit IIABC [Rhodospirillaceae bacterium]|nr:PTS beta-glucoside transporter subunit IIABC [Rhodospirillaceae bacterium]